MRFKYLLFLFLGFYSGVLFYTCRPMLRDIGILKNGVKFNPTEWSNYLDKTTGEKYYYVTAYKSNAVDEDGKNRYLMFSVLFSKEKATTFRTIAFSPFKLTWDYYANAFLITSKYGLQNTMNEYGDFIIWDLDKLIKRRTNGQD